jgi:hypothetical protein
MMSDSNDDPENGNEDGGQDGGDGTPTDQQKGAGDGTTSQTVQMTQSALNDLFRERAERASRSAVSRLLSDLGFEDADGLKTALTEWKEIKDSEKTESERLQSNLDDAKTQSAAFEAQLTEARTEFKAFAEKTAVIAAARDESFVGESLDDVWLLVNSDSSLSDMLKYDEETRTVTGADKAVKKVAEMRPHWVQSAARRGTPAGRASSVPPTTPPPPSQDEQADEEFVRF